jgi:hypothetical protein
LSSPYFAKLIRNDNSYPLLSPDESFFIIRGTRKPGESSQEWLKVALDGDITQVSIFADNLSFYKIDATASISPNGRFLAFGLYGNENER